MTANQIQHGGSHYRSTYQHWDWSIDLKMGYLESAATKYVSRWWKKNGLEDVIKSIHYLQKAKEAFNAGKYGNTTITNRIKGSQAETNIGMEMTHRFCNASELETTEVQFMFAVASWSDSYDLDYCIQLGKKLMHDIENKNLRGWQAEQDVAKEIVKAKLHVGVASPHMHGKAKPPNALLEHIEALSNVPPVAASGATTQPKPTSGTSQLPYPGVADKIDQEAPFGWPGEDSGVES